MKVRIDYNLPEFSATKIVMWECHMDESAKGRYDMILGRYILTEVVLNLKHSKHAIKSGDGPLKRSTAPMIDLVMQKFKDLDIGKITSEEYFTSLYMEELL